MIEYKKGDVLQDSQQKRIIAHICTNAGGFGKGFALAVAKKYPIVKDKFKAWYNSTILYNKYGFELGAIQIVNINENLDIINMVAQNGYRSGSNPVPLDYNALDKCLKHLVSIILCREVWMPMIGSGLAGGNWDIIEKMIEDIFKDKKIVVFKL